jgi:competence CoiA-like predicted nuclease
MDDTLIPYAICSDSNYLYPNEVTEKHREQYHRNQLSIICPECGLALQIVPSKNNHYFFRHFPNQSCALDSKKFTIEYRNYILQQSRESEKHNSLKNKLQEKLHLSDDPLIDKTTICIEKYTDGRRADVYCERNGKKIAFEVQISPLSLSIILERIDHYREKDIHLFWVIEPNEFDKLQFQNDIEYYGLSKHIYELSSDDKLLKCHFKAPKIYYKDGLLSVESEQRLESINLSDLYIINHQPTLFDYEKEEEKLKNLKISTNPIFKESYCIINSYLSWFEKYPNINQKTVFQAAHIIDFIPYIKDFYSKFIHWDIDDFDSDPYMYLECPICPTLSEYTGRVIVKNKAANCDYCDYKNIDLIQYIADMRHNSNKFKAAQEICHNHNIPYKSGI